MRRQGEAGKLAEFAGEPDSVNWLDFGNGPGFDDESNSATDSRARRMAENWAG